MLLIKCGYQAYAWGKIGCNSKVAQLAFSNSAGCSGEVADAKIPYAELWIGTHPSKPAYAADTSLKKLFEQFPRFFFGQMEGPHTAAFGTDVPFLLKVLSIQKALSIQAHPTREHARLLNARDPKNYPDANHKPELVVALTPFEALCGFRPLQEAADLIETAPSLAALIPNFISRIRSAEGLRSPDEAETPAHVAVNTQILKDSLEQLYALPAETVTESITTHLAMLQQRSSETEGAQQSFLDETFVRIHSQFPGDIGCWMVYFMNLIRLSPGEGLFMAPNEPHAYISGDCVEIMAASDNVVRAGLTPKFKDVDTLLNMLTYRTDVLRGVKYSPSGKSSPITDYTPPAFINEFKLQAVMLGGESEENSVCLSLTSVALAVVVSGEGQVVVSKRRADSSSCSSEEPSGAVEMLDVAVGSTFCIAGCVSEITVRTVTCLHIFIATTAASSHATS